MKRAIVVNLTLFILASIYSFAVEGQEIAVEKRIYLETDSVPKVIYNYNGRDNKPCAFINNVYLPLEAVVYTIKSESIESVSVDKQKKTININGVEYFGIINIILKPAYNPIWISFNELIAKYTNLKNERMILSIDGVLVNFSKDLKFMDEGNIMQVKVEKLDLLDSTDPIHAVKLLTRTKENLEKANRIYIRGNAVAKLD